MIKVQINATFQAASEPTTGRACWIDSELAGKPFTTTVNDYTVTFCFPTFEGELPPAGYGSWSGTDVKHPVALSPRYFSVFIEFELVSDSEADTQAALKSAMTAMRFAASRLSDGIRVLQPSVGLVGEIPRLLDLKVFDTINNRPLQHMEPLVPGYPMVIGLPKLTLESAMQSLRDGVDPSLAVLSQARYLTQSTSSPQPGLAILLAALAAETYAKAVLGAKAPPGSTPSLNSLQRKKVSAIELYGNISMTLIGRSLEIDNPALWANLDSLFSLRNKASHEANFPTHAQVRELVIAATMAIEWLG